MNFQDTLHYLYHRFPMFQQQGQKAYKEGLANTLALDSYFNHPHHSFKTIHVGGTNGKGSCSHTLAAILQSAGYRVGLYTSPHLISFTERIRINGKPIDEEYIVTFVEQHKDYLESLEASFFEITTAMAFSYFKKEKVDVAVVEVGLGGRLDCTNVIQPVLSIITNISFDHVKLLGNTLEKIAYEKAGIIKENIPVVVGETTPETRNVFLEEAEKKHAPIFFAEEEELLVDHQSLEAFLNSTESEEFLKNERGILYQAISPFTPAMDRILNYDNPYITQQLSFPPLLKFRGELSGDCQLKNTNTVLSALRVLVQLRTFRLTEEAVQYGFAHISSLTGLRGRWEVLAKTPLTICDTGHNIGGIEYISEQLRREFTILQKRGKESTLRIVLGMVNDKDIRGVLSLLPKNATYYFAQAQIERALPSTELQKLAYEIGLVTEENSSVYQNVPDAYKAAYKEATPDDLIFIGGSTFIVADLLTNWPK
ncbi:MAG: bifunctional folylpolyglutamate synthase/dihydrofolate synthase [Bacteroidaceae bacterium]|nr:bifunctional folylpolyglutamate synthase/dihydrofolate synthase [Bacteroidaceae bacterium]